MVNPKSAGGIQVLEGDEADDDTTEIYEVTRNTTLFLNNWELCGSGAGNGNVRLILRNADDVEQFEFACLDHKAGEPTSVGHLHIPPIEIPQLWDIAVISDTANLVAHGSIHGFQV